MAKRKKILGLPIGKKSGPNMGAWMSGIAAVAGGAVAARRAFQELRESGPVQKGKEAVGQVAEAGKKVSGLAEKAQSSPIGKVAGLLGGGGGSNGSDGSDGKGKGKGRSGADQGHVQKIKWIVDEHIDVGVARREAYNQWTQFDKFSEIFKGVENVDQKEGKDDEQHWGAKVGPSRRQFDVEITEQLPDRRIAWKGSGGVNVQGVVTFHELDRELTRVNVEMVYRPQGFVEHVGNWFRTVRRRVRKDLKLFKEYVELRGEASGEWRGRISKEGGRGESAVDGSPAPGADSEDDKGKDKDKSSSSSGSSRSGSSSGSRRSTRSARSRSQGSSGGSRTGQSAGRSSSARSSSSRSSGNRSGNGARSRSGASSSSGGGSASKSSTSKRSRAGGSKSSRSAASSGSGTRTSSSRRSSAA